MSKIKTNERDEFLAWASKFIQQRWSERGIPPSAHFKMLAGLDLAQSPIERRLLAGLIFCPFGYYDEINEIVEFGCTGSVANDRATIIPQFQIDRLNWRVDFLVSLGTNGRAVRPPLFVIECDGHDFHERTKEQAARDRKRDRDLQGLGLNILRFTGSEIFRDLDGCVQQIDAFGATLLEDAWANSGAVSQK